MAGLPVRRVPYKDFLQPALQRRFASTATVLLAVSYVEALLLASWDSFIWPWFPIGPAGIRTAFIFICGLAILVLRIAHYHVGRRTIGAGYHTLQANLAKFSTYETAFWYFFSSSLFCPVFLLSMPEFANLSWITYFSGDRARVNERPLFLAFYLSYCALKQSIGHFKDDLDHLDMGSTSQEGSDGSAKPPTSLRKTLMRLPEMFATAVQQALLSLAVAPVLYLFFLRSISWRWALTFLRPFYNLPKTSIPPPSWPMDLFLLVRCAYAGTLLFFIWSAGNTAFSIFMVKEPLKNGQPLTSESKDPNGSLLNGLKSKKLSIQCFAMWELALIAQGFESRRKAIYDDIDRKDGPMWSQVYAICMDIIKGIESRADNYGKVVAPAASAAAAPEAQTMQRTTAGALQDEQIFNKSNPKTAVGKVIRNIDRGVQAIGSGPHPDGSSLTKLSPIAKKTWNQAKDQFLSKEQQDAVSPEGLKTHYESLFLRLMELSTWADALLRQDYRTDLAAAALGSPHAEPRLFTTAVVALTQLAVHSLGEDQFGHVHRDVPSIIRTLTLVIRKVEDLKTRVPAHWTDAGKTKESPEVEQVLAALRAGLSEVVTSFEPYCHDLRLSPGDLRLAKEAAQINKVEEEPIAEAAAPIEDAPQQNGQAGRRRQGRPEMAQVRSR